MGVLWARVNHAKPRKGGVEVPPLLHPLGVSERAAEGVIFSPYRGLRGAFTPLRSWCTPPIGWQARN
jgi:hypothetical protein